MRAARRRVLLAAPLAAAALLAVVLTTRPGPSVPPAVGPPVPIGGPFTLTGADGRPVSDTDFRGKWMVVYFGYTHCPDACPTALNDIGVALDMLKARRSTVAPVFVTVDPQRDTPEVIGAYTRQFSPQIVGLTGSPSAIEHAEREYHVYAARHPTAGGGYDMDHSNIIYVIDPAGRFAGVIDGSANPEDIAAQVAKLEA